MYTVGDPGYYQAATAHFAWFEVLHLFDNDILFIIGMLLVAFLLNKLIERIHTDSMEKNKIEQYSEETERLKLPKGKLKDVAI